MQNKSKKNFRFLHVGVHNNIGENLGDKIHFYLLRKWFDYNSPKKIIWTKRQIWKSFTKKEILGINSKFDLVIIGGGGLFLSDQNTKSSKISGWQLNIKSPLYKFFKVPIFLFAVGFNKFRGQKNFTNKFIVNIKKFYSKSNFFSLRNFGSIKKIRSLTGIKGIKLQPCVTTFINKFYRISKIKRKRILSIGFAGDRIKYRFKNRDQIKNFIKTLEKLIYEFKKKNYEIHFVYHKNIDSYYVKFFKKSLLENIKIKNLSNVGIKESMNYYTKVKCLFAMRGHHQLISIGCQTPFFSIITHDKIKFLTQENNLQHFSADINKKNFNKKILKFILNKESNINNIEEKIKKINLKFFNISKKNMSQIFQKIT